MCPPTSHSFRVFEVRLSYGTMVFNISDRWGDIICCNVSSYWNFDLALSRSFRSIACHCRWLTGSWLENRPRDRMKLLDVGKTDELKFRINIWAIRLSRPRLSNSATRFDQILRYLTRHWCRIQHFNFTFRTRIWFFKVFLCRVCFLINPLQLPHWSGQEVSRQPLISAMFLWLSETGALSGL